MIPLKDGRLVPSFSIKTRERVQNNGISLPQRAVYVVTGSLNNIAGGATGSVRINLDAFAFNFYRVGVFHSGAASSFDLTFENRIDNSSSYDPTAVVADYRAIAGSTNFTSGIDQVENLVGLTDSSGSIYMRIKPSGAGNNSFKYIIFFEDILVYVNSSNEVQSSATTSNL